MTLSERWARIWPLALILAVTIVGWFLLADLAADTGKEGAEAYTTAKTWATDILGLAGTLAGFLGIAAATQRLGLTATERTRSAEGGMIGVLAGATLLGVGDWAVPVALAALVTGTATVRVVHELRT